MKKIIIISSLAFSLLACNSSTNEPTATAEPALENKEHLENLLPQFFTELENTNATFSGDSIALKETGNLQTLAAVPINEEKLKPFKKVLVYNSDSTKAVDLFSYNYIITQNNGTPVAEAAGPDTEIALIDFKSNSRKRIWYGGPSTAVLDAKWLTNDELLLAALQENENGQKEPLIWKIGLSANTIETYKSNNKVQLNQTDYLNKRFSSIRFR